MEFKLYKSLVNSALDCAKDKKCYDDEIIAQLKNYNSLMTGDIPIVLDENRVISDQGLSLLTVDPLTFPEFDDTFTHKQILQLHDGTYLFIFENKAIYHVDANFTLIRIFPFSLVALPADITADQYIVSTAQTQVFKYTDPNAALFGSIFMIPCPTAHVVQVYKYIDNVWSHIATLGTLNTANTTTNHLSTPIAVGGFYDGTLFRILVSCSGASGVTSTSSFIKEFTATLANTSVVTDIGEISNGTTANAGSMLFSETKTITKMKVLDSGKTYLVSETLDEFGELNYVYGVTSSLTTAKILKTVIKTIDYNDSLKAPTVFDIQDTNIVIGDSDGHLSILKPDFSDVDKFIGIPVEAASTLKTYPLHFGSIKNITITDTQDVLFIASNKVYRTNILSILNDEKLYSVVSVPATTRVTELIGLEGYTVQLSLDNIVYKNLNYYMTHDIPLGSTIYVKLTNPRITLQALNPTPVKGVMLLKIV